MNSVSVEQQTLPTLSNEVISKSQDNTLEMPARAMLNAPERILLLGWGKFMRGFIPDFVQMANASGQYEGRILASQRCSDYRVEAATRQNGLYTLIARGLEDGRQVQRKRVIGSVSRLLAADREWNDIVAAVLNRDLRVIVSNATETGLTLDPADRPGSNPPSSFPGKLTRLLFERWRATGGRNADLAVIPTELVLNNGPLVRGLIIDQACAWNLSTEFVAWVQQSVHVASTLVDRIVVGTPRPELLLEECSTLGYRDDLLTCCEPYYLLAIEADKFTQKQFPISVASPNVCYVNDLQPFRRRKLRLLNGPQMVITTLGTLLDFRIICEAITDSQLGPFTQDTVWKEIVPAMGVEHKPLNCEYACECLQRIANPTIEHRLQGIRVDLTTKNAIRLFPSLRDYMSMQNSLPRRLLLTVAATIAVSLQTNLEDVNVEYIRTRWSAVAAQDQTSIMAFIRDVIERLMSCSKEPVDLNGITPAICELFLEIRSKGIRSVVASMEEVER